MTAVGQAADMAAGYNPRYAAAPNSQYASQPGNAATFKGAAKKINFVSGTVGTVESLYNSNKAANAGNFRLSQGEMIQAGVYAAGTIMLFTPAAPIGAGMILTMGVIDAFQYFNDQRR